MKIKLLIVLLTPLFIFCNKSEFGEKTLLTQKISKKKRNPMEEDLYKKSINAKKETVILGAFSIVSGLFLLYSILSEYQAGKYSNTYGENIAPHATLLTMLFISPASCYVVQFWKSYTEMHKAKDQLKAMHETS